MPRILNTLPPSVKTLNICSCLEKKNSAKAVRKLNTFSPSPSVETWTSVESIKKQVSHHHGDGQLPFSWGHLLLELGIPTNRMQYPPICRLASHPSSTVLGIAPWQNHQGHLPALTAKAECQTVLMPTVVFPCKKNIGTVLFCPTSGFTTLYHC